MIKIIFILTFLSLSWCLLTGIGLRNDKGELEYKPHQRPNLFQIWEVFGLGNKEFWKAFFAFIFGSAYVVLFLVAILCIIFQTGA